MEKSEFEQLQTLLAAYTRGQNDKHTELTQQIETLTLTLEPIAKIYSQFQGFGSTMSWLFKAIVVPCTLVMGLYEAIRHLK